MGRKSNAEKAAEVANELAEVLSEAITEEEQIVEQIEEVKADSVQMVRMVLHPDFPGKTRTANVHPLEVDNYRVGGWIIED